MQTALNRRTRFRIPITVRQFAPFVSSLARRAMVWLVPVRQPARVRVCYFTCRSYFQCLLCSIHSLTLAGSDVELDIIVFCDRDELFSPEQIALLRANGPSVEVIPWTKAQGWGTAQIASIWEAYTLAVHGLADDAYVARVDSDVFFFSRWLFDFVAKSAEDFVGDGHYVNFEYAQGGVYFIRAKAVRRMIAATPIADFAAEFTRARVVVEDVAAWFLARKAGLRPLLIFFMMFPDEYTNAGELGAYQRRKFACLHWAAKDKAPLVAVYVSEMIPPGDRARFLRMLDT